MSTPVSDEAKGKKKQISGEKTKVDTSPTMDSEVVSEETIFKGNTIVTSFGRMNPPTLGHQKLVQKVAEIASRIENATAKVFLSRTEGNLDNPIPYQKKLKYARLAFGSIIGNTPPAESMIGGFIGILKSLEGKYDNVVVVVGGDRLGEISSLVHRYNGKEFNFRHISVVSAGDRDPDSDDFSVGISASKMRAFARDGNVESFKNGLPSKLKGVATNIINDIIYDDTQAPVSEAVLNVQQRLRRRNIMRRAKAQIRIGMKRALRRHATKPTLEKRSRRVAIRMMRKRILKNRKYEDLSLSSRQQVDRLVAKRARAVARIAMRIEPKLRASENKRKLGSKFATSAEVLRGNVKAKKIEPKQGNTQFHELFVAVDKITAMINEATNK